MSNIDLLGVPDIAGLPPLPALDLPAGDNEPYTTEHLAQDILHVRHEADTDEIASYLTNTLLPAGLTYAQEISRPTSKIETQPQMNEPYRSLYQMRLADRLGGFTRDFKQALNLMYEVRALQQQFPDAARAAGVDEGYWERMKDAATALGRKGWSALGFVLNNLDRGRGSIAKYMQETVEGAAHEDALRKAYNVLRGSDKGWVVAPEAYGPSYTDVLRAAGAEDDYSTKVSGFALNVLLDPVWLIGAGPARKGIQVAAHQYLNRVGKLELGLRMRRIAGEMGHASFADVPLEQKYIVNKQAMQEMRDLINNHPQGVAGARQYLDMGGLKFAGWSIPGTSRVVRGWYYTQGNKAFTWETQGLAKMLGSLPLETLDKLGKIDLQRAGSLRTRVAEFSRMLDDWLRQQGENVGAMFSRTNPAAGKDYRYFKQAEYYEMIGYESQRVRSEIARVFGGLPPQELKALSVAIEAGPEAVLQLPPHLQQVAAEYTRTMDTHLLEEVMEGVARPEWSQARRQQFATWLTTGNDALFSERDVAAFKALRLDNYVPHIYHNLFKYRRLFPTEVGGRRPSIFEAHLNTRKLGSLEEARRVGLVPEYNLARLAAHRLYVGKRALVTAHFFKEAQARYALPVTAAGIPPAVREVGEATPYTRLWQEVALEATDNEGKLVRGAREQAEIAEVIGRESYVPPQVIAKMDNAAIRQFLISKFRIVHPRRATALWKKYVEEPTAQGLYDAHAALGPGITSANDLMRVARDLYDPYYETYRPLKVGGRADPAVFLRGLYPKPIADDLERLQMRVLPTEMEAVLRLWDIPNFWWKSSVTVLWPSFHFRNRITNTINSAADIGIGVLLHRPQMWSVLWGQKGVLKTSLPGVEYTYDEVREMLRRYDVLRTSYRRGDIGQQIEDVLGKEVSGRRIRLPGGAARATLQQGIKAPIPGQLLESGKEFASLIDNSDRALLFMASLKRGMPPEVAARRVNEFLFDYDAMSQVEKKFIRRFIPFWGWCVPEEAEILTRTGWKKHEQLQVGEEVLTLKVETGLSEWQLLKDKKVFPYSGLLMRAFSKRREFLFTPNHRWPVRTYCKEGKYSVVEGYRLHKGHALVRACPHAWTNEVGGERDAAILGWVVTDGYHRWRGKYCEMVIYQHPKKFWDEIVELVGEEGTAGKPHPETGVMPMYLKAELTKRLVSRFNFNSKEDMPRIVCQLSHAAALALSDAMFKAEGTVVVREDGSSGHLAFRQNHGPVLDAFQILTQLLGKPAQLSARGCYVANQCHHKISNGLDTAWYTGNVWCPVTDNGTWFMRYKGSVVATGNTRNNLILQSQLALSRPMHFARMGHFIRALSDEQPSTMRSDVERDLLPRYLMDTYGIRVDAAPRVSSWLMNLDFPQTDLDKWWFHNMKDTVVRKWLVDINPFVSELAEQFLNVNFYKGTSTATVDSGMKVYDWLWGAPRGVKDFLHMRRVYDAERDEHIVQVDATRFRWIYALGMLAGMGRVYTTAGRALDEDITPSHRLWGILTGWRWYRQRPEDELRARAGRELLAEGKGMRSQLIRARRDVMNELVGRTLAGKGTSSARWVGGEDVALDMAVMTPEDAADLE